MTLVIRVLAIAALAVATLGCDPIKGTLEVKKAFKVTSIQKNPNCGNGEAGYGNCEQKVTVSVPVGNHQSQMKMVSRYQLQVSAKIGNKTKTMTFDLPSNSSLPTNGTFQIPASQIGQDFSLQGNVSTESTDSNKKSGYEYCSYTTWETQCFMVGTQYVCQDRLVTRHGQQYVEYFVRTTNKHVEMNFVDTEAFATFTGHRTTSEKFYLGKGRCY